MLGKNWIELMFDIDLLTLECICEWEQYYLWGIK